MRVVAESLLLPPISWFSLIKKCDVLFIDPNYRYTKQTYKNRFEILTKNGRENIVLPVSHPCNNLKTSTIFYQETNKQIRGLKQKLQSAYGKSPWFTYLGIEFDILYEKLQINDSVFNVNLSIIEYLIGLLSLPISIQIYNHQEFDLDIRGEFHPKKEISNDIKQYISLEPYYQTFGYSFEGNLSIVDLLANVGLKGQEKF